MTGVDFCGEMLGSALLFRTLTLPQFSEVDGSPSAAFNKLRTKVLQTKMYVKVLRYVLLYCAKYGF